MQIKKPYISIVLTIVLSLTFNLNSFSQNPGNVGTANLTAWFNPDLLGLGNVTNWSTTFPFGGAAISVTDAVAPYPIATNTPAGNISNYNTTIEFANNSTAALKALENNSSLNLLDNSAAGDQGTFFAAYYLPATTANDHFMLYNETGNDAIQFRNLGANGRLAIGRQVSNSINAVRNYPETFLPKIISYKGNRSNATSFSAFDNSLPILPPGAGSQSSGAQGLYFGVMPGNGNSPYNGYLHEFIFYNTDLSDNEIFKINTYLAVKYGATLDNTGGGPQGDYIAANSTVIWDASVNPAYHNNVFGIGRDDNQGLLQKQSHAFDDTARVYLNTLQVNNVANAGSFNSDASYVVMGDNNGLMNSTAASNIEIPALSNAQNRVDREWKITKTNFSQTFNCDFTVSPSFIVNNPNCFELLVDDDGDFSNGGTTAYYNGDGTGVSITISGSTIQVSNLSNTHIPDNSIKYITLTSLGPIVNLGLDFDLCQGQTLLLDATIAGATYLWQDNLTTSPTFNAGIGTYWVDVTLNTCTVRDSIILGSVTNTPINLGADTFLCHNQTLTLDAGTGFDYYLWSNDSTTQTITTDTAGLHWAQGFFTGSNLIINGDFESGSTGFSTNYVPGTGGAWGPLSNQGEYLITTSPSLAHNNFPVCGDHTSGTGNMMVVNGANIVNQNLWCQTIPVTPNTDYEFSTWIQNYFNGGGGSPAQISFFINGTQIGTTFTSTTAGCPWENFFQLWNSGAATSANICITNQSIAASGNDFALDDISFSPLCVSSDTILVTIDQGPLVTVPVDSSYCAGDLVPASVYTSLPAGSTYDWFHTNTAVGLATAIGTLTPGNTPGFTATNVTLFPDTTTISVIPTLNNCPGDTVDYLIVVNPLPVAPTISDTLICTNNSVTLSPTAPGGTYEWFDAAIAGTLLFTGPSFTTPILIADASYWVQSTINGCTGPRTKVDVTIGAGLIVEAGADVTICPGQTANLAATPNTVGNTYEWSGLGTSVVDTFFNLVVTPTDTTLYKIEITDLFGCIGIDSVTVNVKPLPVVTVPQSSTYCSGDVVPAINYPVSPTGTAFWTNTDPSIGIGVNGWNNTLSFTAVNTTGQPIIDTISVTPFLAQCTGNTATHTITVNPIPTVITPQDAIYCIDEVVPVTPLFGTPPGSLFSWTNTNTTTGMVATGTGNIPSFVATNNTNLPNIGIISITPTANGCTGNISSYAVTVSSAILIDRVIKNASCFEATDGEIRVIPSGGSPNYTYSWTSGETDSIASNLPAGPITVTITDINNCTQDSTFAIIEPDSIDYISFSASPRNGCSPLEVKFTCTIDPALHLLQNYVWDFGNNLVPKDSFVVHSIYETPGNYDVSLTVTDYSGCSSTLTLNDFITIFENPEAHFSTSPDNPTMFNPTIDFSDASFPNVVGWEWIFDTLGNSNIQNPSFIFPKDSGNYLITLIAEDENTCKDTLTQNIFIRSEIALFLPNSFTPNGDGLNDTFTPKGFGIATEGYTFIIFNRWGEIVFQSNNVLEGWDGSYNGELLPSGVYVWRADFRDLNGKAYRREGQTNILR